MSGIDIPEEALRYFPDLRQEDISVPGLCFVVWVNTDLTEGRGHEVPKVVTTHEATARRLAKGANTQGSDGRIEVLPIINLKHKGRFLVYAPARVEAPTAEDKKEQALLDKADAAIKKARDAGLSTEDIAAIVGGGRSG